MSGKGLDSGVAIEMSGDWLLVVTRTYPAFALPVRYAAMVVEVGPEIVKSSSLVSRSAGGPFEAAL